jgi:hypothetical protein
MSWVLFLSSSLPSSALPSFVVVFVFPPAVVRVLHVHILVSLVCVCVCVSFVFLFLFSPSSYPHPVAGSANRESAQEILSDTDVHLLWESPIVDDEHLDSLPPVQRRLIEEFPSHRVVGEIPRIAIALTHDQSRLIFGVVEQNWCELTRRQRKVLSVADRRSKLLQQRDALAEEVKHTPLSSVERHLEEIIDAQQHRRPTIDMFTNLTLDEFNIEFSLGRLVCVFLSS